jgi:hypothetical protein
MFGFLACAGSIPVADELAGRGAVWLQAFFRSRD